MAVRGRTRGSCVPNTPFCLPAAGLQHPNCRFGVVGLKKGIAHLATPFHFLERETGLEPATLSLGSLRAESRNSAIGQGNRRGMGRLPETNRRQARHVTRRKKRSSHLSRLNRAD